MKTRCKVVVGLVVMNLFLLAQAAIPEGYYDSAIGKSGSALQNELSKIIDHVDPGYGNLWDIYKTSDRRSDGKVWDMYSNTTNFTFVSDQCGSYSSEGDCYNREHSVPKSWRGGDKYSDAHMVVPTDGYVNNRRGSYPFGEVGSSSYVSDNSFSKVGSCVTSGYSGTVFEPNDEYKGDFARIYFYAATRYNSECGSWGGDGFSGTFPHLDEWTRLMLLRWHNLDPVSQKEIDRNDAIYASSQGNRNPFVDYPVLVDLIFGELTTTPFSPEDSENAYLESPINGYLLSMGTVALGMSDSYITKEIVVKGVNVEENVTIALSGSSYFTISTQTLAAADVTRGVSVAVTYEPQSSGIHAATLTLAGGINKPVTVSLEGEAVEGFAAVNPSSVSDTSFEARWIKHSQATDYELSVWSETGNAGAAQTLFDVAFGDGLPAGWSTVGYTNVENNAIRLASNNNAGAVVSPNFDMSNETVLTVTCSPYRTSDNSALHILVDGKEVTQIDCVLGEVTESITLPAATELSSITLRAEKGKRVYLQSAQLTTGASAIEMLAGYPCRVGNVSVHLVEGVEPQSTYHYCVVAYQGNSAIETSNTVTFTTGSSAVEELRNELPQGVFVYASSGVIYVDGAPNNSRVNCYAITGTLECSHTVHATRTQIAPRSKGVYVVQLVTSQGCYTTKVALY